MADKKVTRELAIFINDRQVTNSLAGVTREIGKVNAEMRNLNKNSATYDEDLKKLQKDLAVLRDRQSEFKDEIAATNEVGIEAGEIFSKIFIGLSSGNLSMAKEGLEGLRGSLSGMLASARAFIATPIGAAIAVLSGIAIATKAIFDFNVEAEKSSRLIEDLTGKTGKAVEEIRIKIQALTDTFGVQFEQLAGAVDNLVDTGVAKDELQALEQIKQGLLTAPDKNEFIASLESSAVIAKQVGADLNDVIALKKQIEETGVDPEATFGALQKAGKNLALQTDELRKKLTEAFGASFTDEILAKVKTGEITTVQALDMIGKKSAEVGLNQTQQAELGQQLFGKSAQAAGGYATVLQTVVASQQNVNKELNENQKSLDVLAAANERLNKAQSDLFRIEGFGSLWDKIKAAAIDSISSIIEYFVDLKSQTQPLIDLIGVAFVIAWENIKATTAAVFSFLGGALKVLSNTIGTFVNFFKKLFQGDFRGALDAVKQGFINFGNIIKNTFGSIYNAIIGGVQGIVKAIKPVLEAVGVDVDKLQKKLDGFKVKIETKKSTTDNSSETEVKNTKATEEELKKQQAIRDEARKKEEEARLKAAEKEKAARDKALKEEQDRIKAQQDMWMALADAKARLAQAELNAFLANNKSLIENGKMITDELLQQEINRLNAVNKAKQDDLLNDINRQFEKATATAKSQEELNTLLEAIDLEYQTKRGELDAQTTDAILALRRQKEEQDKQLRAEQLALDNELALMEAQTKDEEDKIKQDQKYQQDLDRYKELLSDKKITEDEFRRFKNALDEKQEVLDRQRQLNQVNSVLGGMSSLSNALTELFGQSKEMAYASALINGAQAITSILAQWPKFDGGISMSLAIAAAGISTLAQLRKISTTKEPKKTNLKEVSTPGFFYGGDTGNFPALGYDRFGAVTGVVHEDEWVAPKWMKQTPRYARTIQWLESERQRVMKNGFAQGGNVGTSSTPTMVNVTDNSTVRLEMLLEKLNAAIDRGIMAKVFFGYEDAQAVSDLLDEKNQSQSNGTLNS